MTPNLFIFCNERSGSTLLSALLSEHNEIGVLNDSQIFRTYNDVRTARLERVVRKGLALTTHHPRLLAHKDADRLPSLDHAVDRTEVIDLYRALAVRYLSDGHFKPEYYAALDPRPALAAGDQGSLTLEKLFETVYRQLLPAEYHDRRVLGEKTPAHLYMSEALLRTYPDAHTLTLIRHPLTHIASLAKRHAASVDAAISLYLSCFDDRFGFLYDGQRSLTVRYEDLIRHTTEELRRVHAHLGVAPTDAPEEFSYYNRSSYIGSAIDPGRDAALLASLRAEDRTRIERRCRDVFARFYADDPTPQPP